MKKFERSIENWVGLEVEEKINVLSEAYENDYELYKVVGRAINFYKISEVKEENLDLYKSVEELQSNLLD